MPADGLRLAADARDALFAHAREGASDDPTEICGVLAGDRRDDGPDRVTSIRHVPNVADRTRTRYELDPEAALAAVEAIEADGRDVVGFYHSHPDGPLAPSGTDHAQATWTGYVYVIVSVPDDALAAWRWTGDEFVPLSVTVESP